MGSFLIVVFHRRKANAIDCLFSVSRLKTERVVKGQSVGRGIERNRTSGKVLPHPFEQLSSDAEAMVLPLHKEKADVAFLLPDAQHADQLFLIKGSIVTDSGKIGVVVQAALEFLRALWRVVRGIKLAEHPPRKLKSFAFLRIFQRANPEKILPEFIGGCGVAMKSTLMPILFYVRYLRMF